MAQHVYEAGSRQQRRDLRDVQHVARRLLDEELARLELSDHRLQQVERVALQDALELGVPKVAAEPNTTAAARADLELASPGLQLRSDIDVEDVGLLSGADAGMAGKQPLHPGGPAARTADHEHEIGAVILQRRLRPGRGRAERAHARNPQIRCERQPAHPIRLVANELPADMATTLASRPPVTRTTPSKRSARRVGPLPPLVV